MTQRNKNVLIAVLVSVIAVIAIVFESTVLLGRPVFGSAIAGPGADMTDADASGSGNQETTAAAADTGIIGLWSTEGPSGELVDPATGFSEGSYYSGEWYLFREDGTYRYVIIGSGQILSGGVVSEGRYSVGDGEITLTHVRESWYPDPSLPGQHEAYKNKRADDEVRRYRFEDDGGTLVIDETSTFTRVEE